MGSGDRNFGGREIHLLHLSKKACFQGEAGLGQSHLDRGAFLAMFRCSRAVPENSQFFQRPAMHGADGYAGCFVERAEALCLWTGGITEVVPVNPVVQPYIVDT